MDVLGAARTNGLSWLIREHVQVFCKDKQNKNKVLAVSRTCPMTVLNFLVVSQAWITQARQGVRTLLGPATTWNFVQIFRSIPHLGSVLGDVLATTGLS